MTMIKITVYPCICRRPLTEVIASLWVCDNEKTPHLWTGNPDVVLKPVDNPVILNLATRLRGELDDLEHQKETI